MRAARSHQTASSPAAASSSLMGRMRTNTCRKGIRLRMEWRLAINMSKAVQELSSPSVAASTPPQVTLSMQPRHRWQPVTGHSWDCSCQGLSHLHIVPCPLSLLSCCSCQQAPLEGSCQGLGSAPLAGAPDLRGARQATVCTPPASRRGQGVLQLWQEESSIDLHAAGAQRGRKHACVHQHTCKHRTMSNADLHTQTLSTNRMTSTDAPGTGGSERV